MPMTLDEIEKEALALPSEARAHLSDSSVPLRDSLHNRRRLRAYCGSRALQPRTGLLEAPYRLAFFTGLTATARQSSNSQIARKMFGYLRVVENSDCDVRNAK